MKTRNVAFVVLSLLLTVVIFVCANSSRTTAAADARSTYNGKCATCHGRDGRGQTARGRRSHARDLSSSQWQNDVTDERLFNSISNGRHKMPSFKKELSESDIDALVTYVRSLKK